MLTVLFGICTAAAGPSEDSDTTGLEEVVANLKDQRDAVRCFSCSHGCCISGKLLNGLKGSTPVPEQINCVSSSPPRLAANYWS
jgi:hypothetical protein